VHGDSLAAGHTLYQEDGKVDSEIQDEVEKPYGIAGSSLEPKYSCRRA